MEELRYAAMRWNTPLSPEHADALLVSADADRAATVLDLGCGWGELVLRVGRGVGVDRDGDLIARARAAARERGVPARFVVGDATAWREPAELVLCLGAAHAWGGAVPALRALGDLVAPGGRLLFGDGCWPRPPTPAARAIFGDEVLDLDALRAAARTAGWRVALESPATREEFDEFERSFRAGRERWAAAHPDDPRAAALAAEMAARREEYETVYRGVLGFTYLLLTHAPGRPSPSRRRR